MPARAGGALLGIDGVRIGQRGLSPVLASPPCAPTQVDLQPALGRLSSFRQRLVAIVNTHVVSLLSGR